MIITFLLLVNLCFALNISEVSFQMENDCDQWNTVLICYNLDGIPADSSCYIAARMSYDDDFFNVPLDVIMDAYGFVNDLGSEIENGNHCFFWEMSVDLPDTDGVSWGLQGVGMGDNETQDVAYGTAIVVDDASDDGDFLDPTDMADGNYGSIIRLQGVLKRFLAAYIKVVCRLIKHQHIRCQNYKPAKH